MDIGCHKQINKKIGLE